MSTIILIGLKLVQSKSRKNKLKISKHHWPEPNLSDSEGELTKGISQHEQSIVEKSFLVS